MLFRAQLTAGEVFQMVQNQGFTVWLTGMLGSGKTTLAEYIAARLRQVGRPVEILDEDDLEESLWNENEGRSKEDRESITVRMGFVAELLTRNNVATLVACESPYKEARDINRRLIQKYIEVFIDCPVDPDLLKRDTTGKYKKAMNGEIPDFVGITAPYQPPGNPEVKIQSNLETVEAGALKIFQALLDLGWMTAEELKIITGTKMKAVPPGKKGKGDKRAKGGKAAKPEKPAKKGKKK
jgi:adenylylsulfate kinase